jgi:hypothetical protein
MTRRERLERKLEKRHEWAEKAEARSDAHYNTGHKMLDAIPMGQPILVGHHSEKRDRNYRDRAGNHMSKFVEERKLAAHHEQKAAGLASALETNIFSDDNDAIEALEARVAENETKRDHMKKVNTLYRKADVAGLAALGFDYEALKAKIDKAYSWEKAPFVGWELTNLGARIRTDKKRIEHVKVQTTRRAAAEAAPNGVTYEDCKNGYCRVTFAEKPAREILTSLKAAGFFWGSGCWAGKIEALPTEVKALGLDCIAGIK